jgi:DNA-binding MurR/RpiR family transcriptional regulator
LLHILNEALRQSPDDARRRGAKRVLYRAERRNARPVHREGWSVLDQVNPSIEEWLQEQAGDSSIGKQTRRVIDLLGTNPQLSAHSTTATIAERAGVNSATVVRTARTLGFSGWPELRSEIRNRYLASLSANQVLAEHNGSVSDPVTDAIRQDMRNLETLARTLDVTAVDRAAQAICDAERIVVSGSGTFAAPGLQLSHTGTTIGLDIVLERHGGTQLANQLAKLRPGDCFVLFSFWRLPRELLAGTRLAHSNGATIVVVTDRRTSQLVPLAHAAIIIPSEGVSALPSLTPAMAVVHALTAKMIRIGGSTYLDRIRRTEAVWDEMNIFDPRG